jgi:hypothetical protein
MKKVIFVCCLFYSFLSFSCEQKTPSAPKTDNVDNSEIRETNTIESENAVVTDVTHTEADFYGEWYCETPPQKITEDFSIKGSKDTYIFYNNDTYESDFVIIGQEDTPIKYRGKFSVLDSNIIVIPEYMGIADGRWIETKGLERRPFPYPYKFFTDGRLQIENDIYTRKSINSTAASVKKMSFEEFKTAYNANAKIFSTDPINDWTINTGEKANTARYDFEGGAMLIFLENNEPYYVQGAFFLFGSSGDQLKTFQALFKIYTLILSLEPGESPENIPNFCQILFNSDPDRSIKSKSGNTYSMQDIEGNMLITIATGE